VRFAAPLGPLGWLAEQLVLKRYIPKLIDIRNEFMIAEAAERGDGETMMALMATLREVKLEEARLENQEAIIDGFGVLSGRVKGGSGGLG